MPWSSSALALAALASRNIDTALASLIVLEGWCLGLTLLAALRLSLRDCILAAAVAFFVPALS